MISSLTATTTTRRLQIVVGAIFVRIFLSAVVIDNVDQPLYTQALSLVPAPGDQHPVAVTAFLLALAGFIVLLNSSKGRDHLCDRMV